MLVLKDILIKSAGLGVFAKRNTKRGPVVCYYDGEAIPMNNNVFDAYTMLHPTLPGICRKGYANPRTNKGVGQFRNDGAMLHWDDNSIKNFLTDSMEVNTIGVKHLAEELHRYQKHSNVKTARHLSIINIILSRQKM